MRERKIERRMADRITELETALRCVLAADGEFIDAALALTLIEIQEPYPEEERYVAWRRRFSALKASIAAKEDAQFLLGKSFPI